MTSDSSRKQTPRGFRFSLRTWLVLFLLIGALVGWLGRESAMVRSERLIVDGIRKVDPGVDVYYDYEQIKEVWDNDADPEQFQPPAPAWLRRWFGENLFSRVDYLSICLRIEDQELDLSQLRNLSEVHLTGVKEIELIDGEPFYDEIESGKRPLLSKVRLPDSLVHLGLSSFDVDGVNELSKLESLVLWNAHNEGKPIRDLSFLPRSDSLKELSIHNSRSLRRLDGLENVPNVSKLSLSGKFEELDLLKTLGALQSLDLFGCNCCDASFFQDLPNLEELNISMAQFDIFDANSLGFLNQQKKLKELEIFRCNELTDFSALDQMKQLESLYLYGNQYVESLEQIIKSSSLKEVAINDFESLTDIQSISLSTEIEYLSLSHSSSLMDIRPLSSCTRLESLDLSGCHQVKSLEGMEQLKHLSLIDLEGCTELSDISAILNLPNLQKVYLAGCEKIPDAQLKTLLENVSEVRTQWQGLGF